MVHDHPVLALFHECEAITRWQRLGFAVLDIRERVVAGVDSGAAIHADQLLAECDLETGQDLERRDEVVAQRCSIRSQDRKSTRLNSSHGYISYAVFCLKKKNLNPSRIASKFSKRWKAP